MPDESLSIDLLVEAALFSAGRPMSIADIREATGIPDAEIEDGLRILKANYEGRHSSLDVVRSGAKWAMVLRPAFADRARHIVPPEIPRHTLRTLALIAYHQPLLQSDLKDMVGHKVYEHVGVLVEAGLVRKRQNGLSFDLTTTESFPEYFGIAAEDAEDVAQVLAKRVGVERQRRAEAGQDLADQPPDEVLVMAALAAMADRPRDEAPAEGDDEPPLEAPPAPGEE